MKTTQLFLCTSLLLCSFSQATGQTLTGHLLDENNTPVEFANVILLSLPDSTFIQGTVTDVAGNFRFEKPDKRSKLLRISYVGYEDILSPLRNENMGTLTLKPLATMLGEAVVIGRRPTYSLKRGALTTNVENTLLSGVGTANDVLKRIPGLQVTDGGVTVFGKGAPLIYINGRKVRDISELEQLDSKNIAKVELITNPSAEYDAEVKAVLKIKTLKPVGEGLGGSIRTALQKGEQWSNNQQVSLNYRKQKLDVFGSFYYDKTNRVTEQRDVQTVYAGQILEIRGNSRTPFSSDYIQGDGGLNYQFMPSLKLWEVQNVIHYASGEYHDNFAFALPITMCLVTKIIEPVQQIFVTFPLSIGSGIWRRSTVGFFKSLPLGFGVSSSVDVGRLNGYMTKDVPEVHYMHSSLQ